MAKYNVKTTVVYEYQIEADTWVEANLISSNFEDYQWVMDIIDSEITPVEED